MARVAVVQHAPVVLDRQATLVHAAAWVGEAAREGACLVVFPEAFVPGYPSWMWRLRPGPEMAWAEQIHARQLAQAVDLSAAPCMLETLQQAAREHGVGIVCGLQERDSQGSGSTLFN